MQPPTYPGRSLHFLSVGILAQEVGRDREALAINGSSQSAGPLCFADLLLHQCLPVAMVAVVVGQQWFGKCDIMFCAFRFPINYCPHCCSWSRSTSLVTAAAAAPSASELKPVCVAVSRRPNLENIVPPTVERSTATAYTWLSRHTNTEPLINNTIIILIRALRQLPTNENPSGWPTTTESSHYDLRGTPYLEYSPPLQN